MYKDIKIKMIADKYGRAKQSVKAMEEMAELTQAICKLKEHPAIHPENDKRYMDVLEEIADVEIMIEQLKYLYGEKEVEEIIEYKLDRQIERMSLGRD